MQMVCHASGRFICAQVLYLHVLASKQGTHREQSPYGSVPAPCGGLGVQSNTTIYIMTLTDFN